jgi:hypothetical protein
MYVAFYFSEPPLINVYISQGEGEHKRSKQFYPRIRKGDHVRGIARHVYRERTLFRVQEALKQKDLGNESSDTLNMPLGDDKVLGPTPPEKHHHISKDVCYKVEVFKWLADNRKDPALKVGSSFLFHPI